MHNLLFVSVVLRSQLLRENVKVGLAYDFILCRHPQDLKVCNIVDQKPTLDVLDKDIVRHAVYQCAQQRALFCQLAHRLLHPLVQAGIVAGVGHVVGHDLQYRDI